MQRAKVASLSGIVPPVGGHRPGKIVKGLVEQRPEKSGLVGGGVVDGLEYPVDHLLLPGMGRTLRVVVDDHRIFAALLDPSHLLLPATNIRGDNEGHDGAPDAHGVRAVEDAIPADAPLIGPPQRVLLLHCHLDIQGRSRVIMVERGEVIIAANVAAVDWQKLGESRFLGLEDVVRSGSLIALGLEIQGIGRRGDLEERDLAYQTPQIVHALGDFTLLERRLSLRPDEADACEVGLVVNEKQSAVLQRSVVVDELNEAVEIMHLLLRDNHDLSAQLVTGQLARHVHDVENEKLVVLDEFREVLAETGHGLS